MKLVLLQSRSGIGKVAAAVMAGWRIEADARLAKAEGK